MKRLLLLLLFVAAVLGASAQQVETAEVYLRDGRIVRGRIVERLRGGMIRVQTVEGQSFTFMPGKSLPTWACKIEDKNTKPASPPQISDGMGTTRGKMRGA